MNNDIHCPGSIGTPHCKRPPGLPGQLTIRLLQGIPEFVMIRDCGNSHYIHLLFSSKICNNPGTNRHNRASERSLQACPALPHRDTCAWSCYTIFADRNSEYLDIYLTLSDKF